MRNYHDGGEAILEAFRSLGIDYVISSPGSEWPSVWEALARQKHAGTAGPTYLDVGHEILAVTMAARLHQDHRPGSGGATTARRCRPDAGLDGGEFGPHHGSADACHVGSTLAYAEGDFDPGAQWYRNLSVVGGSQRIVEPVVKWAQQVAAPERALRERRACW